MRLPKTQLERRKKKRRVLRPTRMYWRDFCRETVKRHNYERRMA